MFFGRFSLSIIALLLLAFPGIARADCIDPAGIGGQIKFNVSESILQYCNGAEWIAFPKAAGGATCSDIGAWTAHAAAEQNGWSQVVFANGVFVAVAGAGTNRVMTSPDGIDWTPHNSPTGAGIIAYGDGLFVTIAGGANGRHVMTSPNGTAWTQHSNALPTGNEWQSVTYGNGQFVAISSNGNGGVATSTNGVTWTYHADALEPHRWWDIAYGNGLFVAVSYTWDAANRVAVSADGVNWTAYPGTSNSVWQAVAYGNGRFVVAGEGGAMYSADGINWTTGTGMPGGHAWLDLAYGNGMFVAVSPWSGSHRTMISTDGINWQARMATEMSEWIGVAYGNGAFVAVSRSGTDRVMRAECLSPGCTDPDRAPGAIAFNTAHRVLQWCDGTNWQAAGPVDPGGPNTGCSAPERATGTIVFNADHCILQYCDGHTWRGIGAPDACSCHLPGLRSGLVGHWKFDEGSDSVASDSSVHGNHGALTGSTAWTSAGHLGGAIELNGSSGGVNAGSESIIDNLGPFSIAAWIYPRGYGEGNHGRIVGKAAGTDLPSNGWRLATTNDMTRALSFSVHYNASHIEYVTSANAFAFNAWNFVVVTWDGTTGAGSVHIYVNGVETGYSYIDAGSGTRQSDAAQNLYIGGNAADNRTFDGDIDSVRLYDRVISGDEISALYADTRNCD